MALIDVGEFRSAEKRLGHGRYLEIFLVIFTSPTPPGDQEGKRVSVSGKVERRQKPE
jgi:hypothetical protein